MNFLDLVKMRHSVRNYETRAVEKEKLAEFNLQMQQNSD